MLETHKGESAAPAELQAFRLIDAAMLESKCGVRAGKGESAMKYMPKPLLKGWRHGIHWKLIEGEVYLSSALVPGLRERIRAAQAAREKDVEQVMDACRRRELAAEQTGRAQERLHFANGAPRTPRRRTRTGTVYVPIKDRS